LTAEARIVEVLVLQGDPGALSRADELLARAQATEGASPQVAMLHRLRGWALMQAGELEPARASFEESLRVARAGGINPGLESVHYELLATLDATVRLLELTGESAAEQTAERDTLMQRLGVVSIPRPTLPQD
jgi:hypothetical protein